MSKLYTQICKKCGEWIIVSTGDIGVACQHCGAEHKVEWVPKIEIGEVSR